MHPTKKIHDAFSPNYQIFRVAVAQMMEMRIGMQLKSNKQTKSNE